MTVFISSFPFSAYQLHQAKFLLRSKRSRNSQHVMETSFATVLAIPLVHWSQLNPFHTLHPICYPLNINFQSGSSLCSFPSPPYLPHYPPISSPSIWSSKHSADYTNQELPHYAPSFILLSSPMAFRYSYWHFCSEMHPTCVLPSPSSQSFTIQTSRQNKSLRILSSRQER